MSFKNLKLSQSYWSSDCFKFEIYERIWNAFGYVRERSLFMETGGGGAVALAEGQKFECKHFEGGRN